MSFTTVLTAPQAGMSTSGLLITSGTWWSLLSEQDRLQCIDQADSWTIKRRRLWGNKTAWNPAGCVLERWTTEIYGTIKMIINDPGNYNKIYGDGSHHPGLGRHLWMVADRAVYQEAHPTIVIACKEKRFAKNTIQLLEEMDSFKRLNLGFRFLAHNSKVQYKAAGGGLYPQSEFLENLCGIEVLLPSVPASFNAPSSQWPRATIGGVLKLGKPCYALTVAHVLYPGNAETDDETASWSGSESEYDAEEFEISHESYKSCVSGDVRASNEIGERGTQVTSSADEEPPISIMHPAFVDIRPREVAMATRLELSELQNRQPYVTLGCIGHLHSVGQPEFESDVGSSHDSSVWVCREWDWALIKISDPRFCRPNEIRHPAGHILAPKSISPKSCPPKGNVLTAAGVSGIYESNCTGILCGLTLPGTALMVDAWVINSASKHGDSGGWILDLKNGEIHAIIVATSSNPRFTYVIPAEDIFTSIMGRCGMLLDSIDDMLLTKISATELDSSFSTSFDGGGNLNAASLKTLQRSGPSLGTRPSTRAFSVITSEHTNKSSEPSSPASSVHESPLGVEERQAQPTTTAKRMPTSTAASMNRTHHEESQLGLNTEIERLEALQSRVEQLPFVSTDSPHSTFSEPTYAQAQKLESAKEGQKLQETNTSGLDSTAHSGGTASRRAPLLENRIAPKAAISTSQSGEDIPTPGAQAPLPAILSKAAAALKKKPLYEYRKGASRGEFPFADEAQKSAVTKPPSENVVPLFFSKGDSQTSRTSEMPQSAQSGVHSTPGSRPFRLFPPEDEVASGPFAVRSESAEPSNPQSPQGSTSVFRRSITIDAPADNNASAASVKRRAPPSRRGASGRQTDPDRPDMPTIDEGPSTSLTIRGTAGDVEDLDQRYYKRRDAKHFFKPGRVFALLWHDSSGGGSRGTDRSSETAVVVRRGRFGEEIRSYIRQMVVVQEGHGFCWSLAIKTYKEEDISNLDPSQDERNTRAIIYMSGTEPASRESEKLTKHPLAVDRASIDQNLAPLSRIDFSVPYTVEHNVKAKNIGIVSKDSMVYLMTYFRNMKADQWNSS